MNTRNVEVAVISDLHLATHACKPKKVLKYLKSIQPNILVLNGDIIDSWRFSRNYFPKNHLKVIRQLIRMMEKGIQIYYITGNHDEFLRKFSSTQIGNLKIVNQLTLELDNERTWIFHGDIYDHAITQAKWLAKFGAAIYEFLSIFNKVINRITSAFGAKEIFIYKSVKKFLLKENLVNTKFEMTICNNAISQDYKHVICGHTHDPKSKRVESNKGTIYYHNSGDWGEHFTAMEYYQREWKLFHYNETEDELPQSDDLDYLEKDQLHNMLLKELAFSSTFN
jgi:UDP-2,3-diacylglucosamine pyrophosphatase LpxH